MRSGENPDEIITSENVSVPEDLKYFYYHLQANNKILPVEKYINANMHIWPNDVLRKIKKGPGDWENSVPEPVAEAIVQRGMFGFYSER